MFTASPRTESARTALPFVPKRLSDETLWSWITRIALYYGWTADDFLSMLKDEDDDTWSDTFRDPDFDVDPPISILRRLSQFTQIPAETIRSWRVTRSTSLLWIDDRTAFCPACFSALGAVPYVRSAWIDAWAIDCEIHRRPLISIRGTRRARRLPDWSAAWGAERGWALAANVRRRARGEGARVEIPPTLNPIRHYCGSDESASIPIHTYRPQDAFERELVLLAGMTHNGFSIARTYYDLREELQWRNTPRGFDANIPVTEPVGRLSLRAGAIVIGAALFDLLTGRAVRDPDTANPLRRTLSELHGRPRQWLTSRILSWPRTRQRAWADLFEWPTDTERQRAQARPP